MPHLFCRFKHTHIDTHLLLYSHGRRPSYGQVVANNNHAQIKFKSRFATEVLFPLNYTFLKILMELYSPNSKRKIQRTILVTL